MSYITKNDSNNQMYIPHTPHEFKPTASIVHLPHIYLTEKAYRAQNIIVKLATKEIGWLGLVSQTGENFLIHEVFIVKQEVSGASCELDEDGLAELGQELLERKNGLELVNSLRFWGHSHVRMSTLPSGQDDDQIDDFRSMGNPFMIRGILNKRGSAKYDIFYFDRGYIIKDVPWSLHSPYSDTEENKWQKEIDDKVSECRICVPMDYTLGSSAYGPRAGTPVVRPELERRTSDHIRRVTEAEEGDGRSRLTFRHDDDTRRHGRSSRQLSLLDPDDDTLDHIEMSTIDARAKIEILIDLADTGVADDKIQPGYKKCGVCGGDGSITKGGLINLCGECLGEGQVCLIH